LEIAAQIISGLIEVGDLVHRDLKPANVLFHGGKWKIADFGIAKFVEDATSLETLREGLTPLYGAPEQWRGERPSHATDVYALGCIFYALVTGNPPFCVGDRDDVREAHLSKTPAILSEVDAKVGGFIAQMLRKSPESRPGLQRCHSVLSVATMECEKRQASPVRQALAAIGREVSEKEAADEAAQKAFQEKTEARRRLADEAHRELQAIRSRLFDEIQSHVTNVRRSDNMVSLGEGRLDFQEGSRGQSHHGVVRDNSRTSSWDVAENGHISVRCNSGGQRYGSAHYDFAATLVFATTPSDPEFRWREVGFWNFGGDKMAPYALNPFDNDFHVALSNTMHVHNVAYGPHCIDGEGEEDFQERWINLFAKAAGGKLHAPIQLPIQNSYFQ
jgi:serine/threonine-protein kinase